MSDSDPIEQVARARQKVRTLDARDRNLRRLVVALCVAVVVLLVGVVHLAVGLQQATDLLNRRTPTIAYLQDQARREECVRHYELQWERAMATATLSFAAFLHGEPVVPFREGVARAVEDLSNINVLCPIVEAPTELLVD